MGKEKKGSLELSAHRLVTYLIGAFGLRLRYYNVCRKNVFALLVCCVFRCWQDYAKTTILICNGGAGGCRPD